VGRFPGSNFSLILPDGVNEGTIGERQGMAHYTYRQGDQSNYSIQGNAAFKAGDYPAAIGLYTEAILTKPDDPTFPLNRAAAYLKLGKYVRFAYRWWLVDVSQLGVYRNEDAERDCTTVVTLHASNVKGLFRRAQARTALNKLSDAQKGE
jgi:tetratricopeptide (TPR) repeat protein